MGAAPYTGYIKLLFECRGAHVFNLMGVQLAFGSITLTTLRPINRLEPNARLGCRETNIGTNGVKISDHKLQVKTRHLYECYDT